VRSAVAIVLALVALAATACGSSKKELRAASRATTEVETAPQKGAFARFKYSRAQVQSFLRSCAAAGGSRSDCQCIFQKMRLVTPPAQLAVAAKTMDNPKAPGEASRKLQTAVRSCGANLSPSG
jgi:hypothetical protein